MTAPALNFPSPFNLADHLLFARLTEGLGDRIAVISPGGDGARTWTYAEIADRTHRAAGILKTSGVGVGDRVLLLLPDSVDFVTALLATLKAGAVVAMANPELPPQDVHDLAALTQARAVITTDAIHARLRSALPASDLGARTWLSVDNNWQRQLEQQAPHFTGPDTGPDDVAMWLFTSGSTGKPRAAIHRHRDFAAHIQLYARAVLNLRPDDVTLSVPRLHFPYATGMNLMFPFAVGAATVLVPERPTAADVFRYIVQFSPTVFTTVPTMTAKMLALPEKPQRLSTLRLCISAGETLPPDLFTRWLEMYGVPMLDSIGSAEMFHIYIANHPGDARADCTGRPVAGYRVRVVRPDGSDADADEVGTLWVQGPSAALGYHNDPHATREVFRDDWVVTGDVFRRDPDNYFHYEGRSDDLMKVGGLYVSPLEVEAVLRQHPAVADCAVVGAKDADGLSKPRAFVVLHDTTPGSTDPDTGALLALARQHLAPYKVPRDLVILPELPRNDRGKVLRRLLRDRVP